MAEQREYRCPQCGATMNVTVEFRIPGAREWTRNETLSAVIGTLTQVANDLPEQSILNSKVQAAIEVLERMPSV
jgi:hypothetical protein